MSYLPTDIVTEDTSRSMLTEFRGYNHALRSSDGEWYDMCNITGKYYPVFSPRPPRGTLTNVGALQGIAGKDKLVYVADNCLYYGEKMLLDLAADRYEVLAGKPDDFDTHPERYFADTNGTRVTEGTAFNPDTFYRNDFYGVERTLVSMGSRIVIFPDKRYVNTVDGKLAFLEYEATNNIAFAGDIPKEWSFAPCDENGAEYKAESYRMTDEAPADFAETYSDYYTWNGEDEYISCESSIWRPGYVYRKDNTIGGEAPQHPYDCDVWIDTSGETAVTRKYSSTMQMWVTVSNTYFKITGQLLVGDFKEGDTVSISGTENLDGDYNIVKVGTDSLVLTGVLGAPFSLTGGVTIRRQCPDMDFVIEGENRLWGCRYGISSKTGEFVNEIYACKLGDPTNWYTYTGSSSDAYAVSVGSDGPFTGAILYNGYPTFFKERHIHRISGSYPANYQTYSTVCDGVQAGSGKSLAVVNGTLLYKSPTDIMAYTGGYPSSISAAFADERYYDAVASEVGGKYYVSMRAKNGVFRLFVYDANKGLWHIEDETKVYGFARVSDVLYCGTADGIFAVEGEDSTAFDWYAESGIQGFSSPDRSYVSRINIRASVEAQASISLYIQYDSDGTWHPCGGISREQFESEVLAITPRRCDHYALRIEGRGQCKIYSITRTLENGGDMRW